MNTVFAPSFTLKARWVSGQRRFWREYPTPTVTTTKAATEKAEDLIDKFLPIVRVEIWADGRFIKEVP